MLFILHTTLFLCFIFLVSLHSRLATDVGPLPLEEESVKQQREIVSKAGETDKMSMAAKLPRPSLNKRQGVLH